MDQLIPSHSFALEKPVRLTESTLDFGRRINHSHLGPQERHAGTAIKMLQECNFELIYFSQKNLDGDKVNFLLEQLIWGID